jgi:hypothetical protein
MDYILYINLFQGFTDKIPMGIPGKSLGISPSCTFSNVYSLIPLSNLYINNIYREGKY